MWGGETGASFRGGDQNESWVQSKIPAPSLALASKACNERKKLGSPESNKGPELALLSEHSGASYCAKPFTSSK